MGLSFFTQIEKGLNKHTFEPVYPYTKALYRKHKIKKIFNVDKHSR